MSEQSIKNRLASQVRSLHSPAEAGAVSTVALEMWKAAAETVDRVAPGASDDDKWRLLKSAIALLASGSLEVDAES